MLTNLPDFKKSLVNLVMSLLRAPEEFSSIILTEPDINGDVSQEAMRATLSYMMALLAYGFPEDDEVVTQVGNWLLRSLKADHVDANEMYRLEGLLQLRRHDMAIRPRLEKLAKQRTHDGSFIIQAEPTQYDTLWAIKLLGRAVRSRVIKPDVISLDELRLTLERIIQPGLSDKDLALALRLYFELFDEQLSVPARQLLNLRLLDTGNKHMLWGLTQDTLWIPDRMRRDFDVQSIQQQYPVFCRAIHTTCMVIENLAPLMRQFTGVQPVLRQTLELWWEALHTDHLNDDPAGKMRAIFYKPYDYLASLSLTMIALQAFLGEPLIHLSAPYVHRQMMEMPTDITTPSEKENLKTALRRCFQIDSEGEPQRLTLGLSGAGVARVELKIRSPLSENFIFSDSLVVKYGPRDEINQERENYELLPETIRSSFVNFPQQDAHLDREQQRAYIVMPDLHGYRTLYEYYMGNMAPITASLQKNLGAFLLRIHQAKMYPAEYVPRGIIYDLYLRPMQDNIATAFNYLWQYKLLVTDENQRIATLVHQKLVEELADLTRHQFELQQFPAALMHGDLHTRNIMIRRNANQSSGDVDLDFKLIDLEKVRLDGDPALDIGQFWVDVRVTLGETSASVENQSPLRAVLTQVEKSYLDFAQLRQDRNFEMRYELAKARAYVRIAKGKTRQIEQQLRLGRRGPAMDIVKAMLQHSEHAARHLQSVLKGFNQAASASTDGPV